MLNPIITTLAAVLLLSGCTAAPPPGPLPQGPAATLPAPPSPAYAPTRILDQAGAARLVGNKGVTLQWIDWNTRGSASVTQKDGIWRITATQAQADGPGRLFVDGVITEIGRDYFTLDGRITINDTPDVGRRCDATKTWHFAVTQNRQYYRLREFEWCDGLTDYIDVYF